MFSNSAIYIYIYIYILYTAMNERDLRMGE